MLLLLAAVATFVYAVFGIALAVLVIGLHLSFERRNSCATTSWGLLLTGILVFMLVLKDFPHKAGVSEFVEVPSTSGPFGEVPQTTPLTQPPQSMAPVGKPQPLRKLVVPPLKARVEEGPNDLAPAPAPAPAPTPEPELELEPAGSSMRPDANERKEEGVGMPSAKQELDVGIALVVVLVWFAAILVGVGMLSRQFSANGGSVAVRADDIDLGLLGGLSEWHQEELQLLDHNDRGD